VLKLFSVYADLLRQAKREDDRLLEADLPQLWILAPSASKPLLQSLEVKPDALSFPGVYCLSSWSNTRLIAINQLLPTEDTLWIRLLGKGVTQQRAISEVLAFAVDDPRRLDVLQLLISWKISLELTGGLEQEEQSLMAKLSQAYLEWEQQTQQQALQQGLQ
jgi:hypothetical protein